MNRTVACCGECLIRHFWLESTTNNPQSNISKLVCEGSLGIVENLSFDIAIAARVGIRTGRRG